MNYDHAHEQLGQALVAFFANGKLSASRQRRWASATFSGARHTFTVQADALPAGLRGLGAHEFNLPGHIVADICVVEFTSGWSGCAVEVEALTVDDC